MARENTINIPGELHSAATGNIVAGTDEIFDYDSSMYQNKINEAVGKYENSPEYVDVKLDANNKIIEGVREDGTKVFGVDVQILGSMTIGGVVYKVIENPEWLKALTDADNKIICGIRQDGKFYADYAGVDEQIRKIIDPIVEEIDDKLAKFNEVFEIIDNPEFLSVELDANNKILSSRNTDGVKQENVGLDLNRGVLLKGISDPEGRCEIRTDNNDRIISYRDDNGTLHEDAGIKTSSLEISEDGMRDFEQILKDDGFGGGNDKKRYLPKFGYINIKSENFYLTKDARVANLDDVVCIQMYDDTDANAMALKILSYYYIKSTLTQPAAGEEYTRNSVNMDSVRLELFPAKEIAESNGSYFVKKITKVEGNFYLTSTLEATEVQGTTVYSLVDMYGALASVKVDYTDDSAPDQTTLINAIEVSPFTDVPPYKAWAVNKKLEHYCIADIDFGTYYSKVNTPISIKYQGSYSTKMRKRGLRLTFYKKNDYKKKDKVKIGEMVRLSGYNVKSYFQDSTRVKDPVLSNLLIEVWNSNGQDAYPWSKDSVPYNGATGLIKSFPVETWFGTEFYGLQSFGLKKDEKNYMLDGDDDNSGIFACGNRDGVNAWVNCDHTWFDDEMMDEMSQSTADAIDELCKYTKGFVDGTINIDGVDVPFTNDMLEEHIDLKSWIDYWIITQTFMIWDNTCHNMIIHTRSDKKKFYAFHYDLDNLATSEGYDLNLIEYNEQVKGRNMAFWNKLCEEYGDSILNRYYELRKSILTYANVKAIYKKYIEDIPASVVSRDNERWGTSWPIDGYAAILNWLRNRLEYLDDNNFLV